MWELVECVSDYYDSVSRDAIGTLVGYRQQCMSGKVLAYVSTSGIDVRLNRHLQQRHINV